MSKKTKPSKAATTLQKVSDERAVQQLSETLQSIRNSHAAGQLRQGPDVHPFNRVYESAPGEELSDMDMVSLLNARMKLQGYVYHFDAKLARETFEAGRG